MAIDGNHWYLPDGTPYYTVLAKSGKERAVTLRDARKVGAGPSVTTVLQIVAKPQLVRWQIRQGILAALTLPRFTRETDDEYLDRVFEDSKQQVIDAAAEGTRIHNALEKHYAGLEYPAEYWPHVHATVEEVGRIFPGVNDWVSERSFFSYGYGGKVDLYSPSTGHVIDFKGKDGDFSDGKKLAWDQNWQLGAYSQGLGLRAERCANVFVSRTHPGVVCSHVWSAESINDGAAIFNRAFALWKQLKHYSPGEANE